MVIAGKGTAIRQAELFPALCPILAGTLTARQFRCRERRIIDFRRKGLPAVVSVFQNFAQP